MKERVGLPQVLPVETLLSALGEVSSALISRCGAGPMLALKRVVHRSALLMLAGIALTSIVAGCQSSRVLPIHLDEVDPGCAEVPGLAQLLEPRTAILFGEVHGTREAPAFFADAVCRALASGHAVHVGLEWPRSLQPAVTTFLGPGGSSASVGLLEESFWTREYQDGRSSEAMLNLLRRLREFARSGSPISVFVFDVDEPQIMSAEARERSLADRVVEATERTDDLVLVLTGNLHARLAGGTPWDGEFQTMGERVSGRLSTRRWLALDFSSGGGTAWICTDGGVDACGSRRIGGDDERAPGVHLSPRSEDEAFDGWYHLGVVRASPPAVGAEATADSPRNP